MNYTPLLLIALGTLGILLHNLVELNKLNRSTNGNIKIGQYLKLERFSIIIAFIMVCTCLIIKQEIKQLESVGKWLGLAFIAIGYMGQSLLIWVMGRANKVINKENDETNTNNNDSTTNPQ